MGTTTRRDALVRHLRRQDHVTVAELAQAVGASRRTVLRDLAALRDAGLVIHSDVGRGGGLRLDPGSVRTTARLSVSEVFALLVGVAVLRAAGTMPFGALAEAGLARIEAALPRDKLAEFRGILGCLHVGRLSPHQDVSDVGEVDPALLGAFEAAFLRRQRLRFAYRDRQGAASLREVEPQAMLVLPPLWYLVAWDPSREGFRNFRMDRIASPEIVEGTPFRRRRPPFEEDVCPWKEVAERHRRP
ncbi:MAG: helix-turn-helix transcriptional regulator [Shimia sp.]